MQLGEDRADAPRRLTESDDEIGARVRQRRIAVEGRRAPFRAEGLRPWQDRAAPRRRAGTARAVAAAMRVKNSARQPPPIKPEADRAPSAEPVLAVLERASSRPRSSARPLSRPIVG